MSALCIAFIVYFLIMLFTCHIYLIVKYINEYESRIECLEKNLETLRSQVYDLKCFGKSKRG